LSLALGAAAFSIAGDIHAIGDPGSTAAFTWRCSHRPHSRKLGPRPLQIHI
jgi:hypothetical protein